MLYIYIYACVRFDTRSKRETLFKNHGIFEIYLPQTVRLPDNYVCYVEIIFPTSLKAIQEDVAGKLHSADF